MAPSANLCLLLGACCGAGSGSLGVVLLALLFAWHLGPETADHRGFFVAVALFFGALPGLLNGLVGTLNGLLVGRHRGGWPVECVPLLMLAVAWLWDRENPKVGMTLIVCLVPAAFVLAAGFLGQVIGIRGRPTS